VDRTACVELAALPLQLLLRRHPEWRESPVAVVDRDKPQGTLLWINRRARAARVERGMRYAAALGLERELRAGVVPEPEIAAALHALTRLLWNFSPRVEACTHQPGRFWLDAGGLARLAPSLQDWADALRDALREDGFYATVAVGYSRFGSRIGAAMNSEVVVFPSPEIERARLRDAPLARLDLAPRLLDLLRKLDVHTLGTFADLPAEGIRRRFGGEAQELHALARGELAPALQPAPWQEPACANFVFEMAEENALRLLDCLRIGVEQLLAKLDARGEALTELRFLLRLRMESLGISCGVTELRLRGQGAADFRRQKELFHSAGRDLDGAQRAFARLRAEFGNAVVVRARLLDGHLPEARYDWEVLEAPPTSTVEVIANDAPPLVRRIAERPRPIAAPYSGAWYPGELDDGPVEELIGPQLLSGGWWVRETTRAYHYARTRNGRWLWVYHDLGRDCWFLHGEVS